MRYRTYRINTCVGQSKISEENGGETCASGGGKHGPWGVTDHACAHDLTLCVCDVCVPMVEQDASELRAVNGQVGTLVMDRKGQVLSSTGELLGSAGDVAAEILYSMLQVRSLSLSMNYGRQCAG